VAVPPRAARHAGRHHRRLRPQRGERAALAGSSRSACGNAARSDEGRPTFRVTTAKDPSPPERSAAGSAATPPAAPAAFVPLDRRGTGQRAGFFSRSAFHGLHVHRRRCRLHRRRLTTASDRYANRSKSSCRAKRGGLRSAESGRRGSNPRPSAWEVCRAWMARRGPSSQAKRLPPGTAGNRWARVTTGAQLARRIALRDAVAAVVDPAEEHQQDPDRDEVNPSTDRGIARVDPRASHSCADCSRHKGVAGSQVWSPRPGQREANGRIASRSSSRTRRRLTAAFCGRSATRSSSKNRDHRHMHQDSTTT
jgi:hypothetical protein